MSIRNALVVLVACVLALVWGCAANAPGGSSGNRDSGNGGSSSNQCAVGLDACSGACTDLRLDVRNCGQCGTACGMGQSCQTGACSCLSGLEACPSGCTDLSYDPMNCGACGTVCPGGTVCSQGACADECAATLTQCGAACVDATIAVAHCGGCNNACPSGLGCSGGACVCPVLGEQVCGGVCANVQSSVTNCGTCGNLCGAGQTCQMGICTGGGQGGSGGMGGTAGAGMGGSGGSTVGPPPGLPGVVVSTDAAGTLGCVPLCMNETHPDDADMDDDWAYEGYSCILPNSPTGTRNQACTTGQPLPPINRNGLPGVVVDSGGDMILDCVPLCAPGALPSSPDPGAEDWGWEYQASCIIRDSNTARCNQACSTGQALPSATLVQRPGVIIDDVCTALCACGSAGSDPNWGWEYQLACVVPNTTPSTGRMPCTLNDTAPMTPPPVTGAVRPGFYTENGKLYDARGTEFVMRGVNNPHIWFADQAYLALGPIASHNTNTIRVVWETTGGSVSLLARTLFEIVRLKMVPMIELHDVTGSQSAADLARMAAYYTDPAVRQVLIDYRAYLLINIANEWSGTGGTFDSAYRSAITTLRNAGLEHTLVIDGSGFGQDADTLFNYANGLTTHDPQHNLLFSVHMYSNYATNAAVDTVLNRAVSMGVPLIVGEFGPQLQGRNVAWQQVLTRCQANRQGYIAWSWSGNDAMNAPLNIVNDFNNQALTASWGRQVMVDHAASISKTAVKASIFP
jgi:mannan endo-1,4-beta-mannosidase